MILAPIKVVGGSTSHLLADPATTAPSRLVANTLTPTTLYHPPVTAPVQRALPPVHHILSPVHHIVPTTIHHVAPPVHHAVPTTVHHVTPTTIHHVASTTTVPATTTTDPTVTTDPSSTTTTTTTVPVTTTTKPRRIRYGTGTFYSWRPGQCASYWLKKGTWVTITNLRTGVSTRCLISDTQNYYHGSSIVDMSMTTFSHIAPLYLGRIDVSVTW